MRPPSLNAIAAVFVCDAAVLDRGVRGAADNTRLCRHGPLPHSGAKFKPITPPYVRIPFIVSTTSHASWGFAIVATRSASTSMTSQSDGLPDLQASTMRRCRDFQTRCPSVTTPSARPARRRAITDAHHAVIVVSFRIGVWKQAHRPRQRRVLRRMHQGAGGLISAILILLPAGQRQVPRCGARQLTP